MNNDLPLAQRLKRALILALILGLWAPVKIIWERGIAADQDRLRYHHVMLTRQLRDKLGQGLTIGLLSGMRSVVADFAWLQVTAAWEKQQWFRVREYVELCTNLQPRSVTFWLIGGWHLAFNASIAAREDNTLPELRRIRAERFWIEQGRQVLERGLENNPDSYELWNQQAQLYQIRLKDYRHAALCYEQATLCPGAPIFYERFPAKLYQMAGDDAAAYRSWVHLWKQLTPEQLEQPAHTKDQIILNIRALETKLNVPKEKRIFPN